jgi:hypothetical protein
MAYLGALKEEGVPDVKISVDRKCVHEHAQEPVQGEHRGVYAMGLCG